MNLKARVKQAGARAGLELAIHPNRRLVQLLTNLEVDLFLDVGAAHGTTGLALRRFGYPGALHSFEPLPSQFERLKWTCASDNLWKCSELALSDTSGYTEFFTSENLDSSSLLRATDRSVRAESATRQVDSIVVQTRRLDDVYEEILGGFARPFLKIDTQGTELRVIDGAKKSLESVVGCLVEVSFRDLYEGGPLALDVINDLSARGFVLRGFVRGFADPISGEQLQADVIMTRS